jgi:cytochrome c
MNRSLRNIFIAGAGAALVIGLGACDDADERAASVMTQGGQPQLGKEAINAHGCGTCHTIPGVRGADALVGPPLTSMGQRSYIGGVMKNTPANMIRWIQDPPAVDPMTAMPKLNVSESDARNIASYLYTLK